MAKSRPTTDEIEDQIIEKQRSVDYDIKEFTIELLNNKYTINKEKNENEIYIPSYQREFVWSEDRQSKFIESIILGLPIPYIFTSDMEDGRLEIVDGSQRIRTIENFIANNLTLRNIEILDKLNDIKFKDLAPKRQRKFLNSSLRMIVLSDKSDDDARFMLFERINTGSDLLTSMEKRIGIYQGDFIKYLDVCSKLPLYRKLAKFTIQSEKRREPQELLLRFFAYADGLNKYDGDLNDFLNNYVKDSNKNFKARKAQFDSKLLAVLTFIDAYFPNGFLKAKTHNSTPRNRFEALAVGVHLALKENPKLVPGNTKWLNSSEFDTLVTQSGSNTGDKVKARIDFVRKKLLGKDLK